MVKQFLFLTVLLGQKIQTLNTTFHLLSAGSRERTKWTQYAAHSSWQQLPDMFGSFEMFSHFLDLFDILGSPQHTYHLLLLHRPHVPSHLILSGFTEPAATSPSSLPAGGPSWGSLSSIGGASDCGIGHLRWSPPDQFHRFQHLVPTVPDENVGIPHAAQQAWSNLQYRSGCKGSEGSGNTFTCSTVQYTLHKYTWNVFNTHKYKLSLQNTLKDVREYHNERFKQYIQYMHTHWYLRSHTSGLHNSSFTLEWWRSTTWSLLQ